ncbi:DUF4232 domain-containing protein [Dactylosporangium sp. NPDC000244]|uniref:DUF4232 domain-containing protein n=1 Tax=Dactylosporangium sp. NPDC000244 TaxID=3154365 RepID=UPI00332C061F
MDIEQLIRQELADKRHMQTGWTEPVPRVQAGIRRRRRRRYTVASSVVAAAVLVGLGAVNILQDRTPEAVTPAQGTIAWTDTPASLPNLTRRSPRPDVRACTESDLAGKPWAESNTIAASGAKTYTVLIANGSDTRCTLGSAPQLTALRSGDGEPTALAASTQAAQHAGAQMPATVDPGEPVRLDITVTPCANAAPPTYSSVAITIGQHHVTVPGITPGCEFAVSPWYVQAPLINAPLTVSMSAPGTVRRGSTLTYQVTIANTADQAFKLNPCPVYQQGVGEVTRTYQLNCSTTTIPKHASLTYEMHLDVPASATPGPSKVTWMAALANGTVAIANLATGGETVQIVE